MKSNLLLILLIIPIFSFSQFRESEKDDNGEIGSFYDETRKAPFSLSKIDSVYKMCFYNTVTMRGETQMICLSFKETEKSMNDFYEYVLNVFSQTEKTYAEKYLETNQYKIKVIGFMGNVSLEFHDKNSNIRNDKSITSIFFVKDWKKLFGKN